MTDGRPFTNLQIGILDFLSEDAVYSLDESGYLNLLYYDAIQTIEMQGWRLVDYWLFILHETAYNRLERSNFTIAEFRRLTILLSTIEDFRKSLAGTNRDIDVDMLKKVFKLFAVNFGEEHIVAYIKSYVSEFEFSDIPVMFLPDDLKKIKRTKIPLWEE